MGQEAGMNTSELLAWLDRITDGNRIVISPEEAEHITVLIRAADDIAKVETYGDVVSCVNRYRRLRWPEGTR